MAEAIISQISDDFLECTICLEPYKDPKVLPCLHTFCKDCLEKFVAQQGEGKDGNFPCPTCRIETELPGGGVEGLKDNFFVLSLKDAVDVHKKLSPGSTDAITCSTCDEGHEATCWCRHCDGFLCTDCLTAHQRFKATRDHDTISLHELKNRSTSNPLAFKSQRQPTCPEHNGEELRFYCQTCQSPICRDCLVLEHKDHEHGYLPKVVGGIREKLSECADKAQPKIDEYQILKEKVANKKTELDTNKKKAQDAIAEAIDAAIKEFTDNARRKQAELEEKLASITATRLKQLSATEDTVESALGCLSSTVDYARKIVEHGSDFDVVNVYSDVTARLDILLSGQIPEISDDVDFVEFKGEANVNLTEINFGIIVESAFCTAKFTTLGATGREGPATLGAHYRGQDHEHLVTLHDGIQHFTVPATGTYRIQAAGAAAGWSPEDLKSARGRGAEVNGTFRLEKGETLKILVGQEGAEIEVGQMEENSGVGGGGGTFVTKSDNTPLIIAGGGGGGGRGLKTHNSLCDGTVSTAGNRSFAGKKTGFSGGTDGQGATEWEYNYMGGGGGGLLTDGGSSKHFAGDSCPDGGEGGKAFVNGGVGGRGQNNNADGGFGGGGGGEGYGDGGGGGGGYSGGGRGCRDVVNGGGGGGSFISGSDTSGQAGANDGPGYVIITMKT
ncbi:E3 ubiquitin-protein ligase TRIM71-like [Branchiostoma floridae x Branchiostoma belcheri]